MKINVGKDMLFLFSIFLIAGINASAQTAQTAQTKCALKVFVNDPFSQIFVDDKEVGPQPQLILCSAKEKNIVVKSSDGQVFSRVMKSESDFDLTNTTLNVVFHRQAGNFYYGNGTMARNVAQSEVGLPESSMQNLEIKSEVAEGTAVSATLSTAPIPLSTGAAAPIATLSKAPYSQQVFRKTSSQPASTAGPAARRQTLKGIYVQISALKTFDQNKVLEDIDGFANPKVSQQEIVVCPWQNSLGQEWSLILLGPFREKSAAQEIIHIVGGNSFVVTNPRCHGDFSEMRR